MDYNNYPPLQPTSINHSYNPFVTSSPPSQNFNNLLQPNNNYNIPDFNNNKNNDVHENALDNALENAHKTVQLVMEQKMKEEERRNERPQINNNNNMFPPQNKAIQDTEDSNKVNERFINFLSSVENRLNSLENTVQKLRNDYLHTSNNQQNFNEEFLKAISSLSNDIVSSKSVLNVNAPAPVAKNPNFSLSPLSAYEGINKISQEESDSEIAKRLQDEFDKQQPQPSPQPIQYPNLSQSVNPYAQPVLANPNAPPRDNCPICNASFTVGKELQLHVESHLGGDQPANQQNQSGGNFITKLFSSNKSNPPQNDIRPPTYATPNPGYPINAPRPPQQQQQPPRPVAMPMGMPPGAVYYNYPPNGQIPQGSVVYGQPPNGQIPQGSVVYGRPPPNGQIPQQFAPQQFMNPDGTIVYAYPQPPK